MKTLLFLAALALAGCSTAPVAPKAPDLSNRTPINKTVPAETPGAVLPGAQA